MTSNVNHWSYPFAGDAGNPLANLTSLAKARGGYYPMGANGLWHGGVHFDQGTAVTFDQSSVRCIADGEVIAYRIDDQYPISEYIGEIPLIKRALFSTGFVLVRHRLALPPLHPTPGSDGSEPALTFYSLYMHLQDWAGYQAQASLPRPDFWGEGTYCVETQGSDLNVRLEPSQSASILAVLPKGTRVRVGASNGQFRKLLSIVSGAARPALAPADDEGTLPGYVAFKFLKAQSEPKTKGSVVVLDEPVPIKAGDLIGHLGRYQNHDEAMPQPLLHLEVFSCEDVPAFVAQSRAYASRLPETQRTLLKIYKGASKLIPHREGIDADNPPRLSDEGVMVGVDLMLPQSLLDSLPADAKLVVPASTGGMSCSPETRWWRLDNLLVDKDDQPISGWLAEQEMITTRHSPWEWEGYDFIEDRERPAGALAYHLEALRRLADSERASYQGMIDQSDMGPVKQRLYAILDSNGDQKITPEEISTALSKPWHAQSIAQLITKHESEWLWNPDKWDELDELMEHSPADPNPDWAEEKKRIEKLSWWKELGGNHGVNADGVVWHFHPMELLAGFIAADDENDLEWLKVPRGQLTFDAEGNDIEDPAQSLHIYFSRVIHWPGGVSGVTIGRGYDLGQRPNPEKDLSAAKIAEPLYSWLLGAKRLKGKAAKDYLSSANSVIREAKISRRQQYELFVPVYDFMKSEVIRISSSASNISSYGALNWEVTDKKIQDLAVDLIYRGDYTPASREKIQQYFVDNDIERLRTVMADRSKWLNVPEDRFNRRVDYLRRP
ncbi:hypothetical protein NA644_20065 [Pseudomonas stutzeri]|uniref:Uncharacterized protein n=1 Tax=Stutzerimonas stutzeri TaxID=316 RepID=A0A2N8SKQ6_STUST|nr:hypothetical protein [Stutzerimonas stutzeri]MCQ4251608.1 hypothetical protein [Stutzerimonas stutzeri]PNG03076.1 hypothetical protein CXL00_22370 [Stutzerimonas stutzeri]